MPGGHFDLCETLLAAVRNLAENPKPAIALSGGLDSSLILAMLAASGFEPVPWILDDGACNPEETANATMLCRMLGLEPNVVRVTQAGLPARFADAVRACGGLVINARAISKFLLFEQAAKSAEVIFSGAGADEILFGDPEDADDPPSWYTRWRRNLEFAATMLKPRFRPLLPDPPISDASGSASRIFRLSTETERLLLPIERNIPAALGLKPALSFLAPEVISLALEMGKMSLVQDGEGKAALRCCARKWLPEEICRVRKKAVVMPASSMERRDRDQWENLFRSVLDDSFFERFYCFDKSSMLRCLNSYANAVEPILTMLERALMSACSIAVLAAAHH